MPSRGEKFKIPGYQSWADMLQRCKNPKLSNYSRYGGRGIRVCERWMQFDNFYADMGDKPRGMTLGRIDNDGDYEPGNCRWETMSQQNLNKSTSRLITWRGKTQTITEWSHKLPISRATLTTRLSRGWPVDQAFTVPPFKSGDRRWPKHRYDSQ